MEEKGTQDKDFKEGAESTLDYQLTIKMMQAYKDAIAQKVKGLE